MPLHHTLCLKQRSGRRLKEKIQLSDSRRDNMTRKDVSEIQPEILISMEAQILSKERKEGENAIQKHIELLVLILEGDELNSIETQKVIEEFI